MRSQRMSRGRDLDFIYATNSARPGSDVDLHKRFMGPWFNTNLVSRMGAIVNTISALRALVLQNLLRTTSGYWLTYKVVWSMVRSAYWGRGWWKSSFKRKMNDCSMTFQNISALRALGGDVKKNVHFQWRKIRSFERNFFQHLQKFSALRTLGCVVRIY